MAASSRLWRWVSLAGLLLGAAALLVGGPLPPDVAITRWLQAAVAPDRPELAYLADLAVLPGLLLTIGVSALLVALFSGWRAAVAVLVACGVAKLADFVLRLFIFAPRPSPDLVAVAKPLASSGLPSTFALMMTASLGLVAIAGFANGLRLPRLIGMLALVLLVAGLASRIVTGGHWASQVLASALLIAGIGGRLLADATGRR